jgi:hypothetical protein
MVIRYNQEPRVSRVKFFLRYNLIICFSPELVLVISQITNLLSALYVQDLLQYLDIRVGKENNTENWAFLKKGDLLNRVTLSVVFMYRSSRDSPSIAIPSILCWLCNHGNKTVHSRRGYIYCIFQQGANS